MTIAPDRMVICSSCSRPLGEFSSTERTRVGPCCAHLPTPWRDARDQDPDEDTACLQCPYCGDDQFRMIATRTEVVVINSMRVDPGDTEIWFAEDNAEHDAYPDGCVVQSIQCRGCGRAVDIDYQWN